MKLYSRRQGSVSAKVASLILMIGMNLMPAGPLLAQEVGADTTPPAPPPAADTGIDQSTANQPLDTVSANDTAQTDSTTQPSSDPAAVQPDSVPVTTPTPDNHPTGPDTAFSSPEVLAKYTPEQQANAKKFDISPAAAASDMIKNFYLNNGNTLPLLNKSFW